MSGSASRFQDSGKPTVTIYTAKHAPAPDPRHDCALVERDNLDLHQALATAIRQLKSRCRELRADTALQDVVGELEQVLDRTSRPALSGLRQWAT